MVLGEELLMWFCPNKEEVLFLVCSPCEGPCHTVKAMVMSGARELRSPIIPGLPDYMIIWIRTDHCGRHIPYICAHITHHHIPYICAHITYHKYVHMCTYHIPYHIYISHTTTYQSLHIPVTAHIPPPNTTSIHAFSSITVALEYTE